MNARRKLGTALAASGIIMLFFGVGALPAQGAERPMPALQPSPRPAIDPVHRGSGNALQMGHVTGTVIDQRTGAPTSGVTVSIGGVMVTTDANGNYDYWLPVGSYPVALNISAEQGMPTQSSVMVDVQANNATVQHLGFMSSAPAVPVAVATAMPTAAAAPTPLPQAAKAPTVSAKPPKRLPRTGAEDAAPWIWAACGLMLLIAGGVVGFAPVLGGQSVGARLRAQTANSALLYSLLAQPPADEFLAGLIAAYERRRR